MGCGNTFKTISSDEVSCNIESKSLGIVKEDCLSTVLAKLIAKVEYLWDNKCSDSEKAENQQKITTDNGSKVDYSLNPVLKMKKGTRGNTIEANWEKVFTPNKDEIVRKHTEIYTSKGKLIGSSSGDVNVFELQPKDYPLNVAMKAYVNTQEHGMVVAEKIVPISADMEKELSPSLEVRKNAEIEDTAISTLNAEIAKLRELLDQKADK